MGNVADGLPAGQHSLGAPIRTLGRSRAPTRRVMEAAIVSKSDDRWQVRLVGEMSDLSGLATQFDMPGARVIEQEGSYYLESQDFAPGLAAADVRSLAEKKLAIMNGAMRLRMKQYGTVTLGGEMRQGGNINLCVGTGHIMVRGGAASLVISGVDNPAIKGNSQLQEWLILADRHDAVAMALRLVGGYTRTWSDLYRLYEVVNGDVGGIDKVTGKGWATNSKIELFKRTANHPNAAGDGARHGHSTESPPRNPMLINDAEMLVFGIVEQWLAAKGSNR